MKTPARKLDEVLLEGVDAEGVLDRVVLQLTVRAVGPDHEPSAVAVEAGFHAEVREPDIVEVAQHRLSARLLHGQVVMRASPTGALLGVARNADTTPDIYR